MAASDHILTPDEPIREQSLRSDERALKRLMNCVQVYSVILFSETDPGFPFGNGLRLLPFWSVKVQSGGAWSGPYRPGPRHSHHCRPLPMSLLPLAHLTHHIGGDPLLPQCKFVPSLQASISVTFISQAHSLTHHRRNVYNENSSKSCTSLACNGFLTTRLNNHRVLSCPSRYAHGLEGRISVVMPSEQGFPH